LTPNNQSQRDTFIEIVGAEAYNRLVSSIQTIRQQGRLLDWQKQLLSKITDRTGVDISTVDQFLYTFKDAKLTVKVPGHWQWYIAALRTTGFAITVLAFGLLYAVLNAFWFWDPNVQHYWLLSRSDAFQAGIFFAVVITFGVSFLFGIFAFSTAFLFGDYIAQPASRLIWNGCLWGLGFGIVISCFCGALSFIGR